MKYLKIVWFWLCVSMILSAIILIFVAFNKQYDRASTICRSYGKKLQTLQIAGHEIKFICVDDDGNTIPIK